MAKLRKNSMGNPSGKVGGLVYKSRKGKSYIATEPVFTKPRESPLVIEQNNKFTFFGKLTPRMQSDPRIRTIWESSDVKGDTARHKIMHINNHRIDITRDLTNMKLVPSQDLFPVELTDTVYGVNRLTLTFAPFNPTNDWKGYPTISAHGVVHYFGCKIEDSPGLYMIDKVSSPPVPYRKGEPHSFTIEWDTNAMNTYNSKQFCITLILDDRDGIHAACSVNVMVA